MQHRLSKQSASGGFTIVELMIAMSVLAVLLVICTVVMLGIGRLYVKGNNRADVQNTARNIVKGISSDLKLGGGEVTVSPTSNSGTFCIGTTRYNYIIGREVGVSSDPVTHPHPTKHALWRDTMTGGASCISGANMQSKNPTSAPGQDSSGDGVELIPSHMRLTNFSVTSVTNEPGVYNIEVGVAYGDNDLLCVRGASLVGGSDCDTSLINQHPGDHASNLQNPTGLVACVGDTGQQFCATSNLSATVARRLAD